MDVITYINFLLSYEVKGRAMFNQISSSLCFVMPRQYLSTSNTRDVIEDVTAPNFTGTRQHPCYPMHCTLLEQTPMAYCFTLDTFSQCRRQTSLNHPFKGSGAPPTQHAASHIPNTTSPAPSPIAPLHSSVKGGHSSLITLWISCSHYLNPVV